MTPRKIILVNRLSPGDVCTLTAAIESLHALYPGRFVTDVRTSCDAIFEHNPRISRLIDGEADLVVEMHYTDLIVQSDGRRNGFIEGYCDFLGKVLGIPLPLVTNRPHLYLSEVEKAALPLLDVPSHLPNRFWLVNAGVKSDFTLKQWPVEYYQAVVDHFLGKVTFVQIGSAEHNHPTLQNVINRVGLTNARQLIRLTHRAQGGLGPITFLQHLCAAFEKPYVALLGGREPVIWTQYPLQTTMHTMGKLSCCLTRACWRSRVVPLRDGSEQDRSLCEQPVLEMQRPVGKCMSIIHPVEVIRAIEACYEGGALSY